MVIQKKKQLPPWAAYLSIIEILVLSFEVSITVHSRRQEGTGLLDKKEHRYGNWCVPVFLLLLLEYG